MPRSKLEFTGSDGNRLAALLEYPEQGASGYALFAHCFSCGKDIAAASRISRALVKRGIGVLRFDFTGLGNSDGDFSNTNFSSNVADLVLAADFLRENYRAPQMLIGHSLGGTAVLAAAGDIPESKAVVTIGAPASPEHVLKQFSGQHAAIEADGQAEVSLGGRPFTIKRQFIDDAGQANTEKRISNLRRALLVMHSPIDRTVAIEQAEQIYMQAKHPKSFVSLDTADHLLTRKQDAEYVAAVVAAWSSRFLDEELSDLSVEVSPHGGVAPGEIRIGEHNHQFARTVQADEHRWLADEPTSVGGHELGPDPYEHLLAALGTCTSMTMRMYATRKGLKLDDISVIVRHERSHVTDCDGCDKSPLKLEILTREISLKGELSTQERAKLMEIADKCPVHRTLVGQLRIETRAGSGL